MERASPKDPVMLGIVSCPCGSTAVEVRLINLGRTVGIDHVDFMCRLCGRFINHMDVTMHAPDLVADAVLNEVNEEILKSEK